MLEVISEPTVLQIPNYTGKTKSKNGGEDMVIIPRLKKQKTKTNHEYVMKQKGTTEHSDNTYKISGAPYLDREFTRDKEMII